MDEPPRQLEKLEEAIAFTERAAEQLSEQIVRAFAEIERLNKRLAAIESRVGSLEQPSEPGEEEAA